jgi:hypothetical protein
MRVVVFGDFNGPYGTIGYGPTVARVVNRITREWKPDLVLMPGDLVAGQSLRLSGARLEAMWQGFDRQIAAPLRQTGIPYAATMGNHDASAARNRSGGFTFALDRAAAKRYWDNQRPRLEFIDRFQFPFAYSFRLNGIFIAVVDASSATLQNRDWLTRSLASTAAQQAPMRIVMGHLPLYGISEGRSTPGNVLSDGEEIRGLLEGYGVKLYISGHHAAHYPAKRGKLTLLHAGGIGGRDYLGYFNTARSTVTLLELWPNQQNIRFTTYDAVTGRVIPITRLPPSINGLNGRVTRFDLAR